jgi:hypothetical protein
MYSFSPFTLAQKLFVLHIFNVFEKLISGFLYVKLIFAATQGLFPWG